MQADTEIRTSDSCTNDPAISVIIPTYNRKNHLQQAIESVLSQAFTDYEIIIVDDGSSDGTASIVAEYAIHHSSIRYQYQHNRGVAAARNCGISMARGKFVCFLDSDDIWKPHKLETQIAFAAQNPDFSIISSDIDSFNETGVHKRCAKQSMYSVQSGYVLQELLFNNWIQTSTVMVRRSLLESVGGFDESVGQFAEDWVLWMCLATKGPAYFLPEALVFYRLHTDSLTSQNMEAQYKSLMLAVDCVAALPGLQERKDLTLLCRYKIAMGRAKKDFRAKRFTEAQEKFRNALHFRQDDWRARCGFLACSLLCKL